MCCNKQSPLTVQKSYDCARWNTLDIWCFKICHIFGIWKFFILCYCNSAFSLLNVLVYVSTFIWRKKIKYKMRKEIIKHWFLYSEKMETFEFLKGFWSIIIHLFLKSSMLWKKNLFDLIDNTIPDQCFGQINFKN